MRDSFGVDRGEGQFGDHKMWMKREKAAGAFGHAQVLPRPPDLEQWVSQGLGPPFITGSFISGCPQRGSLQSRWGQLEVTAVPEHQWLLTSHLLIYLLLFVFLHFKNMYPEGYNGRG